MGKGSVSAHYGLASSRGEYQGKGRRGGERGEEGRKGGQQFFDGLSGFYSVREAEMGEENEEGEKVETEWSGLWARLAGLWVEGDRRPTNGAKSKRGRKRGLGVPRMDS